MTEISMLQEQGEIDISMLEEGEELLWYEYYLEINSSIKYL